MITVRSNTYACAALLVGLIIVFTPLAYNTDLAIPSDGYLLCLIMGTIILTFSLLVRTFFKNGFNFSGIRMPDILLVLLLITISASTSINDSRYSLEFVLELLGLSIIYITVRSLKTEYTVIIIFSIILSGVIQAIYGALQLYGLYPSNHYLFKITGSFINPGPYAGYLAAVFPVALAFLLREKNSCANSIPPGKKSLYLLFNRHLPHYLYLTALISIIIILPATRSRASWLATIISSFLLIVTYLNKREITGNYYRQEFTLNLKRRFKNRKIKVLLIILCLIIIGISCISLYYMKKDSADGRLLIWKVTTEMIAKKPLIGHGTNGFEANYMNYQADYFSENNNPKEALLAGNNKYAFNIFLKILSEYGLIGFIICLLLLYQIFFCKDYIIGNQSVINGIRASILSVLCFGMFSYPEEVLPLIIIMVTLLALYANHLKPVAYKHYNVDKKPIKQYSIIKNQYGRIIIFTVLLFPFAFSVLKGYVLFNAYRSWSAAYKTYQMGAYKSCLDEYRQSYNVLEYNGDFLLNYGKALSMADEHEEAVRILTKAGLFYPNTVMLTALGDSYKKLGIFNKAEKSYINAMFMTPGRFYPEYLLAILYYDTGRFDKAIQKAKDLLSKEVKVSSPAIKEIKLHMRRIIESPESIKSDN